MTKHDPDYELLTEKQRLFLEYLATDAKGDIRAAMTMAGYSKNTRQYEVVNALKPQIKEIAENLLAFNAVKAVHGLIDVVDNPNQMGAGNKIAASNSVLDRGGIIKKEEVPKLIGVQPIFFLPEKMPSEPVPITIDSTPKSE